MEEIVTLFVTEKQKGARKRVKSSRSLSPSELELLRAVYHCKFITAEQIVRYRGLSINSLSMIQTKLKILSGHDPKQPSLPYVQRFYQARYNLGSLPYVYTLTPPAKKLLQAMGLDVSVYERIRKITRRLPHELSHHLAINEFYIAALHLPTKEPRISLSEAKHDWKLKHTPLKVQIYQDNNPLTPLLVPDGYFAFTIGLRDRIAPRRLFLEMDMNSHEKQSFSKKIHAYLAFFSSGAYVKQYGNVRNVSVVFATPQGKKRCMQMLHWTQELCGLPFAAPSMPLGLNGQLPSQRDCFKVFRFVSLPPGGLDPRELFLQPCAYSLWDNSPQPIIRLPQ